MTPHRRPKMTPLKTMRWSQHVALWLYQDEAGQQIKLQGERSSTGGLICWPVAKFLQWVLIAVVDAPALVAGFNDVTMVRQSIQERCCHFGVGKYARPLTECEIGGQQNGRPFV